VWTKNLKTTIPAGLYFLSVLLSSFGIDIPKDILLDVQGFLLFLVGFFAKDYKSKNEIISEKKEPTK
jgi:ABC-type uncharacterized transport system involved in gliding motility auxiliary subunit